MSRLEIIQVVASVLGALGVIAGAFGSHALKTKLEAREATKTWDTAVKYHFIHTLALVHVGLWRREESAAGTMQSSQ